MLYITIFFLVVYASGGLCKSSVEAAYRSVCHLLRLVCTSGLCQQSHVLAFSLLLVVAGDVETNPGPLDGRCAVYMLTTTCMMKLDPTVCAIYFICHLFRNLSSSCIQSQNLCWVPYSASKECDLWFWSIALCNLVYIITSELELKILRYLILASSSCVIYRYFAGWRGWYRT